jgi:hypothetical protein
MGVQVAPNVGIPAHTTEAISIGFDAVTGGASAGSADAFAGVMPHRVIEAPVAGLVGVDEPVCIAVVGSQFSIQVGRD